MGWDEGNSYIVGMLVGLRNCFFLNWSFTSLLHDRRPTLCPVPGGNAGVWKPHKGSGDGVFSVGRGERADCRWLEGERMGSRVPARQVASWST